MDVVGGWLDSIWCECEAQMRQQAGLTTYGVSVELGYSGSWLNRVWCKCGALMRWEAGSTVYGVSMALGCGGRLAQ